MSQHHVNRRLGAPQTRKVKQVVETILSATSPQKTLAHMAAYANHPDTPIFERYAGMVLKEAGALQLSQIAPFHAFHIVPPGNGKLARITCQASLSAEEMALVANVENAINRITGISDAIEDGFEMGAKEGQPRRISISLLGGAFLPDRPGYRSAFVTLPQTTLTERPTLAYFNEVDWRVLDHIASNSHTMFQNCLLPNVHQSIMGAFAPALSDWDVRTRLAGMLEGLELPFRFEYSFDCDTEQGSACVRFSMPPLSVFPLWTNDLERKTLEPANSLRDDARMVYTIRLSCLLAACCFGSGRVINKAFIIADDAQTNDTALSCAFERDSYVREILTAIDDGNLSDPAFRFDISELLDRISCCNPRCAFPRESDKRVIVVHETGLERQRVAPAHDSRTLPPDMQRLFRAYSVSDIDTQSYFGPRSEDIDEAKRDSLDSALAAIAHLESVVSDLERELIAPGDGANVRPLYCNNAYARVAVSLLDKETSVSLEAESFLHGEHADVDIDDLPFYFRTPNALYHAHMGLSDLYERLGDVAGAESEANRCIALAPTTADAHFRKAHLVAQRGNFIEAANIILAALPFAVSDRDTTLLYYHLALLLWNMDRKHEASAVFVFAASKTGEYANRARKVVDGLRKRRDGSIIVHASPLAASREMTRCRIPVSPNDATLSLVAQAALGLACAHAPRAAAPYCALLMRYFRDDATMISAFRSIEYGVIK